MAAPTKAVQESTKFLPSLSIVRMLYKHRYEAGMFWLAVTIVSAVCVQRIAPTYRAEAVVLVDAQKIPEHFVSSTVQGDIADRLALISQNIMSGARLLEIIRAFSLYPEQREHLTQEELLRKMREDISINVEKSWTGGRMQAFRLAYEGSKPQMVAAVANRLAGLYVAENIRSRESQAEGTVDFFGQQLGEARKSLNEQESKLSQFKMKHNGELPQQENALLSNVGNLRIELQGIQESISRAQDNRVSLEVTLSVAESSETMLVSSANMKAKDSTPAAEDSAHRAMGTDIDTLRKQLRELRRRYTPEYPAVEALEREINESVGQESQILSSNADASTRPASEGGPQSYAVVRAPAAASPDLLRERERIDVLRVQIKRAEREIQSLEKQRRDLIVQLDDCESRIARLPLVEQEMAAIKRDYDESANNYNSLLQKKLAAGVATDMERAGKSEQFTVIDPARVPQKPVKPKRALIAAIGSLAGLAIGLLYVCGLELRKQIFFGEWELPAGTLVLGRVPVVQAGAFKAVSQNRPQQDIS